MVGGPEVSRAVKQFKSHCCLAGTKYEENHHEEYDSYRSRFNKHVNKLVCSFRDKGNPFVYSPENDNVLYSLDSREVVLGSKVEVLLSLEKMGLDQANTFFNERVVSNKVSLWDPIKQNRVEVFVSQSIIELCFAENIFPE